MTAHKPMQQMSPAEHAAMGWSHGQYKDGHCFALMSDDTPEAVEAFRKQAAEHGARYIALWKLPEYMG